MVKETNSQFNSIRAVFNKYPSEFVHTNDNQLWCIFCNKIVYVKKAYQVELRQKTKTNSLKLTFEPKKNSIALHTCIFTRTLVNAFLEVDMPTS